MHKEINISVFQALNVTHCFSSSDGEKIFTVICNALNKGAHVVLSFKNIDIVTASFLNSAIGQLYDAFSTKEIPFLLKVQDMQQDDLALLKRVVENAKNYFLKHEFPLLDDIDFMNEVLEQQE